MIRLLFFLVTSLFLTAKETVVAYAVDRKTGAVIFDEESERSVTPASCLKLITTAAALHLLGPNYRFCTEVAYTGEVDNAGTLHGNLYIRGGGDPTLGSGRLSVPAWDEQIGLWVAAIKKAGIRRVKGRVIGDATAWERSLAPPGWAWEDLGNYYGAGASALSFHENSYDLIFAPGQKEGEVAHILRTEPPLPALLLHNEVRTGPANSGDRASIFGSEFSSEKYVRGTVPAAVKEFRIRGSIPDPGQTCAALLAASLESEDRCLPTTGKQTVIHTTLSPTVAEIVAATNQKSINLYAEALLKAMGRGSTQEGIRLVTEWCRLQGIDLAGFQMSDGSGLSRTNLVTARQLVGLLQKMQGSALFLASLPEISAGVRAKSGTMSLVKGYAGYTGDIAFAVIVNNEPDAKKREAVVAKFLSRLQKSKSSP